MIKVFRPFAMVAIVLVAMPSQAKQSDPCKNVRRALNDKKVVVLSFVSSDFARGCGDNETCNDWAEYLGVWRKARGAEADVMVVSPAQRLKLLRRRDVLPSFSTIMIAPAGRAALYRGVIVEPQVYDALENFVRGRPVEASWAAQVTELQRSELRCF